MTPRVIAMSKLCAAAILAAILVPCTAAAQIAVTGNCYFADRPFPEFHEMGLWQEGWGLKDDSGNKLVYARRDMPLGGYLFVYLRNNSSQPVQVRDIEIQGIRMSEGMGVTGMPEDPNHKFEASILLSKLPPRQIAELKDAGWPAWWKPEPASVPPGGLGEIVIRLKRPVTARSIKLAVVTSAGKAETALRPASEGPRFMGISFAEGLKTVYLYPRHKKPGAIPAKVFVDGRDVTARCSMFPDRGLAVAPVVIDLDKPLQWMAYHQFKAVYPDGSSATAGIRAWAKDLVYGMWGYGIGEGNSEQVAKRYLSDWAAHNINAHMGMGAGVGQEFLGSEAGWDFVESLGMGRMTTWTAGNRTPLFFFLMDEPDAHDAATGELKPADRLGSLGQYLVRWGEVLRRSGPDTPILLNIDNTYKPENWYMYHQLADIPCLDPYYPEQIDQAYANNPGIFPAFTKPTYVYAASAISQSAAAPKPLHVILCSTQYETASGYKGRFPTPEEKRMEVYYAIGAGAKGLSYWWYVPSIPCNGVGDDTPEAQALWKEIGLLGAEVRTAGDVIATSCPVDIPIEGPQKLWLRTLIRGGDTLAVVAVNDNVLSDRVGTVHKPIEDSRVTVSLPSWLKVADAFEVSFEGVRDVGWSVKGSSAAIDLGTVDLSRFVILTSDPRMRDRLAAVYEEHFATKVRELQK